MKHPTPEEWARYVGDETPAENRQSMSDHLAQCVDCSQRVQEWKGTLLRLDEWRAPLWQSKSIAPWIKWAAAAAIVLSSAFVAGNVYARHESRARQAMLTQVEQRVDLQLSQVLRAERAQRETWLSNVVVQVEARAVNQAERHVVEMISAISEDFQTGREEDRARMDRLVERIRTEHSESILALRRDLETLAANADDEIQKTKIRVAQFLATNQ